MWTIRRAEREDKDALVELCRVSAGPDDYVPAFLSEFLATGVVFEAEEAGNPIGVMVYHDVPDGSVWLHAARTRPDRRQQGVATALMAACETLARERGRTHLRLWAAASNVASMAANRRYGYAERARFTRMRAPAEPGPLGAALRPLDPVREWAVLESSSLLARTAHYVFHDFYFLPLTRDTAERLGREGALWHLGASALSLSEDFEEAWGKDLQVELLAGDPELLLRAGPAIAAERGAERVEAFLPHEPGILATARAAGFAFMDWGQEAVVFEKPLRTTSP